MDTIYEENQQMLRQLDDLRSEYEIFAESTKNMQELFASRELVLRTVFILFIDTDMGKLNSLVLFQK